MRKGLAPNEKWRMGFAVKQRDIRTIDTSGDSHYGLLEHLNPKARLGYLVNRVIMNYGPYHSESLYRNALRDLGILCFLGYSEELN